MIGGKVYFVTGHSFADGWCSEVKHCIRTNSSAE